MADLLAVKPRFSAMILSLLLVRNQRVEADLVDQIFNSAEKRQARTLLLLASPGPDPENEIIRSRVSHELFAEIIGTTWCSRQWTGSLFGFAR